MKKRIYLPVSIFIAISLLVSFWYRKRLVVETATGFGRPYHYNGNQVKYLFFDFNQRLVLELLSILLVILLFITVLSIIKLFSIYDIAYAVTHFVLGLIVGNIVLVKIKFGWSGLLTPGISALPGILSIFVINGVVDTFEQVVTRFTNLLAGIMIPLVYYQFAIIFCKDQD
ncbi:hypothetical protein [Anaerolentibacter hominis]|uniref:hypothetical protein n=1 Tax=Anaerolentibacter hominis TaxID=3079009 RepID=UPI0031B7EE0F